MWSSTKITKIMILFAEQLKTGNPITGQSAWIN